MIALVYYYISAMVNLICKDSLDFPLVQNKRATISVDAINGPFNHSLLENFETVVSDVYNW